LIKMIPPPLAKGPPPLPGGQSVKKERIKKLPFTRLNNDDIQYTFFSRLDPSRVEFDREELKNLFRLSGDGSDVKPKEAFLNKESEHEFKILCNLIKGMNDDRVTHVIHGDVDKVFEGVLNVIFNHINYFNMENLRDIVENEENSALLQIARRINDIGFNVVYGRVIYTKMYFIAKSVNCREEIEHFGRIVNPIINNQPFKDFVLLSSSLLIRMRNQNVSIEEVYNLDENTPLLDFIVREYNKRFPGHLEQLFQLLQPFDELESGYGDFYNKLNRPLSQIEDIKASSVVETKDSDEKTRHIATTLEHLERQHQECRTLMEEISKTVYSHLGNNTSAFDELPLRLSRLYSYLKKVSQ